MQFYNGQESKVLEILAVNARVLKSKKDRVTPSTLTQFKPVFLPPRSEMTVQVTTRTTDKCLVTGRKKLLAKHRLHMAHAYTGKWRGTPPSLSWWLM